MHSTKPHAVLGGLLLAGALSAVAETNEYAFSTVAGAAPGAVDAVGAAARFNGPSSVAVDRAGNVFVADINNHAIRKIAADGAVSTLAGLARAAGSADGIGGSARFNTPRGVAVDGAGNVYVADSGNNTIRKITPDRIVTTLAGLAGEAGSADGRSEARFNMPRGIAVDGAGTLYVTNTGNNTTRRGVPSLPDRPAAQQVPMVAGTLRLSATPQTATTWNWQLIRRPAGSTSELSSTASSNPEFTPWSRSQKSEVRSQRSEVSSPE